MTSASVLTFRPRGGTIVLLALGLLLLSPRLLRAAPSQGTSAHTNAVIAPLVIPQAHFADDPQTGRDPFYPDSRRRVRALPTTGHAVAQSSSVLNQLALKGISRAKGRPLALVNTLTLAAGEQGGLKLGDQKIKFRCLEIRDRSILLAVEGTPEPIELHLRKGM